jgi:tetratricopeptide (TPR) repeat protein
MRGEGRALVVGMLGLLTAGGCAPRGRSSEAELAAPGSASTAQATPPLVLDDIDAQLEVEIRLHQLRLEHRDPAEHVRARMDLADAYLQRAERAEARRFELGEERFDARDARRAELDRRDAELKAQRDHCLARAAEAYEHVLASPHPLARKRRAEARFGLADVRTQQGDVPAARQLLQALVGEDPEHALAAPALLILADDAFNEGRLLDAGELYERVVASDEPRDRTYARYKLGWIALNHGDDQAALEYWTHVVIESRIHPERLGLANAAARDCVMAYAAVGRPDTAGAFFARLYPERSRELLQQLARRYIDIGRPDAAAIVEGRSPHPSPPEP